MTSYLTLTIPADLEALEQLTPFIESIARTASGRMQHQLALAVHELCVNIIQHAYAGTTGQITLQAECYQHGLCLSVYDSAPNAFRNVFRRAPDPLDLPESGWGLVILHRVMDGVSYVRQPRGNTWHLVKFWEEESFRHDAASARDR